MPARSANLVAADTFSTPTRAHTCLVRRHFMTTPPLACYGRYEAGMGMVRQIFFGALDMALHHHYDPHGEKVRRRRGSFEPRCIP